jgi:molybdopterin-guanine dinucleotide biosynthesis protein A
MTAGFVRLDNMLMIGSAGSNVGKTELACALIDKFSTAEMVAIKVTAIRAKDGRCPRGGKGCGVCTSLHGNFIITQETRTDSHKDTSRLLAAGASRVYWLRVLQAHLREGLSALLDVIGPDTVIICESNSLRRIVKPGLFVMVQSPRQRAWKPSARSVRKYADLIVTRCAGKLDFDIERIELVDKQWRLHENATAVILAGGQSTRIGRDKSALPVAGRTMLEHIYRRLRGNFTQLIISSNRPAEHSFPDAEVVPDQVAGRGPLMGIASVLNASSNDLNFVIACDIPEFDMTRVRKMLRDARNYDALIPETKSRFEPLFAVYKKSVLAPIEKSLASGNNRIMDALKDCKIKYIDLPEGELTNINTMADYKQFLKRVENGHPRQSP